MEAVWPVPPRAVPRIRQRFRAEGAELIGVEIVGRAGVHQWRREDSGPEVITLFPHEQLESLARRDIFASMRGLLDSIDPDAVIVPAYSTAEAQAGLAWARNRRRRAVVMTASGREDAPRSRWRERVKRAIVSQFDAALAGGTPQARYIHDLGIPDDRIFVPTTWWTMIFSRGERPSRGPIPARSAIFPESPQEGRFFSHLGGLSSARISGPCCAPMPSIGRSTMLATRGTSSYWAMDLNAPL